MLSLIEKYDPAWSIESQIGEGSFSKVYKIVKEESGCKRYSAMKVIPVPNDSEISQLKKEGLRGASLDARINAMASDFLSEVNLMRELKGTANIVDYEDHKIIPKEGEPGCYILMRMELLESLAKVYAPQKFGEEDALRVGIDICRALERLETSKIIHMDVKPENIFLSKHGDYKLGDFGIARRIEKAMSGMPRKGTYSYMAPEVFKGQECGTAADLYSLAIVLYRLLNNSRIPFLPSNSNAAAPLPSDKEAAFNKRMRGDPLPPPVAASQELSRIILKACTYERNERYASASEMRTALKEYACAKFNSHVTPLIEPKPPISFSHSDKSEPAVKPPVPEAELLGSVAVGKNARSSEISDATFSLHDKAKPLDVSKRVTAGISRIRFLKPLVKLLFGIDIVRPAMPEAELLASVSDSKNVVEISDATPSQPCVKIKGIAYSATIETVDLSYEKLSSADLDSFKSLTNLHELILVNDSITDISSLSTLSSLNALYLSRNQITDISPLSELKNIRTLYLDNNQIKDISPLSELTKLDALYLSNNQIADISPLSSLAGNMKRIYLHSNQIQDISSLSSLTNMLYLDLRNNPVPQHQVENLKEALPKCYIYF